MADQAKFSWYDYDSEASHFSVNTEPITAANFAAIATATEDLKNAAIGLMVTGMLCAKDVVYAVVNDLGKPVPASPLAQREIKWLVTGQVPGTDRFYGFEMPCADLTLLEDHQKYIWKNGIINVTVAGSVTKVNAFATAFEAIAKSPTGEALELWEIKQVGRNL